MATDKKMVVAYIDKELEDSIFGMRKYAEYQRLSKSEIIRKLILAGLRADEKEKNTPA